ncbi:MAG: hypothetical protein A2Y54_01990 [Chloroflexi bacterium RBG_16_51_16]|nr:MAG: hypothetical protein A2Y54_01990 [Chloroflexi bacterium RBG_16_51_16]
MDFNGSFNKVIEELVMNVLPSLVIVRGHRFGGGAGMIWSADGLVLTNNHVVGRRKPIIKLNDESEHEARLISRSPEEDLALLKIDASDLKPLEPAPENPRVGELAFAFGHPWGQRNSVTRGIVSALLNAKTSQGRTLPVIRSDAPLAPGNSGGPLVNSRGQVIGINAMIMGGDQSLAISVQAARNFVLKVVGEEKIGVGDQQPIPEGVL